MIRRFNRCGSLGFVSVTIAMVWSINIGPVGAGPTCFAAEPVMLSLMIQIDGYCPGQRLTKDGVAAFRDVWNRGERRFGALFMSRCIAMHVTNSAAISMGPAAQGFRVAPYVCNSALDTLEGWRSEMAKERGPLAERVP